MDRASLWERVTRASRRFGNRIDHRKIAEAGVRLADEGGLAAVTLRKLASELGVSTMALYRYVTSRADIVDLMADAVHPVPSEPPPGTEWQACLSAHAKALRSTLKRHPWLLEMAPQSRIALSPRRLAATEALLKTLDGSPLSIDRMMLVVEAVSAYAVGIAANEIALAQSVAAQGLENPASLRRAMGSEMAWLLHTGEYPTYARYIAGGQDRDDLDGRFQSGLDLLIDGIALQATRRPGIRTAGEPCAGNPCAEDVR